jgi:hypothetical protein
LQQALQNSEESDLVGNQAHFLEILDSLCLFTILSDTLLQVFGFS